jgi:serine/threonine-protein kinase
VGADSTFAKGDRIDRFEIRELIGQGGMGAIYRAVDTKIGRTVALKVIRTDRLGSSSGELVRQRFLRETLALSKVEHRNVVRVLDFGFSGDTPYLAMEYLRGQDLGKLLKSTATLLPIGDVVDVMLEVCAAISACHDAGIIHRDLKPSNVFLCEERESERIVKILDFGVSKPPVAGDLTREGQIVGTPQYLAPEQIDGKAVPQTDQYAVGVMLYACLTKTLPYHGHASFGLLRAIVLGKFPPPAAARTDLPEKLEGIILRAMRIVPDERYPSIHELGKALWEFATPVAREKWRSYYFDERLRAPPKASTHAMPLIEALARGIADKRGETMIDPEGPAAAPAATPTAMPFASTALADSSPPGANAGVREARVMDESEPIQATNQRRAGRRAWAIAALAGVALVIGIGAWWKRREAPGRAPLPATAPASTPPHIRQPPTRETRVPAPAPARRPEASVRAVPAAPPAQPRASAAPATVPAAPAAGGAKPTASSRAEKRPRHNKQAPLPEQKGDGVPIMP